MELKHFLNLIQLATQVIGIQLRLELTTIFCVPSYNSKNLSENPLSIFFNKNKYLEDHS